MADQLLTGTTLVENTSRSAGDVPVGGIIEFDDTYASMPDGFLACDGSIVNDPNSSYDGQTLPDLNTNYWTCSSSRFIRRDDGNSSGYGLDCNFISSDAGIVAVSDVDLPNGITITSATAYGDAAYTWRLYRKTLSDGTNTEMATALAGVEDTSITHATTDTETYAYDLVIGDLGVAGKAYGIRLTYTPRFKFIVRIR